MSDLDSTRDEVSQWLQNWHAVVDACIPTNSIKWLAEDSQVQFNNAPKVSGKALILKEFESIVPIIQWQKTEILSFGTLIQLGRRDNEKTMKQAGKGKRKFANMSGADVVSGRIYCECNVTFIAKGDPEQVPAVVHRINVFERVPQGQPEAGLIKRWMTFFDSSPLKERVAIAKEASKGQSDKRVF